MIPVEGRTAPGYEAIADAFASAFAGRPQMGAALAVRIDGEDVVNLWGGIADTRTGEAWTAGTATVIFSCTKGLMSILLARLVEDGRLDYDARVSHYWPEFAAAGKQDITVRQAIAHQAGLSAPRRDWTLTDVLDWSTATELLAAQAPLWPPGTGYAYHALTHGWLTGELVRRITGMSPGAYFSEAVATPLDVDAWIGLPDGAGPVAHLSVAPALDDLWADMARDDAAGGPNWTYRAMTMGAAMPPSLVTADGGFNDPRVRRAQIPGAGGIATAQGLATIWSATVCETAGVRLLKPETAARATQVVTAGPPVFDPMPPFSRWGMGFQLDSESRRYLTGESFGHDGAGGQVAFADPRYRVGFAFITNWMEGADDPRATAIIDVLRTILSRG